ncbi:class I SAM-dependent methyltransferase [Croceicoccus sp. F390]|uniref:Class I SAM-dependent methyltransferase n=1 Tax=Croceicoccus esteveae TaxID=3075597 RepID=A0ABU2ZGL6_9SPHN|nr:class I SAM-dependent methyltransferase [Croceicoccus sp. F390]MDT0575223.1 class I SAM-dependent methyltransferase [Croceicoccus sp. F390]
MENGSLQRLENERRFHDQRFTDETRGEQESFYAAIKHGSQGFGSRVRRLAKNADLLEYGCGAAMRRHLVASSARTLTGIDITQVAVDSAAHTAREQGLDNTCFMVMTAEELRFADNSFDLIFGRGIIHHLDLATCYRSLSRVLRPGGTAIFWEPLGHNVLLNFDREHTPQARTIDEHPLMRADFMLAERHFGAWMLTFCGRTTILSVPVRDTSFGDRMLALLGELDAALFKTPVRWYAWHVMMELQKARK